MRQQLFLSVVWVLLFYTSCSQEETEGLSSVDNIRFSVPAVSVETSARSTFYDEFPEGGSFGVLGYCVPYQRGTTERDWGSGASMWDIKKVNAFPDVFYKQKVTYNGTSCSYTYTGEGADKNLKKWYNVQDNPEATDSDNFRYTFFAYYPYDAFKIDAPVEANTIGAPKITFTMPFPEGNTPLLDDEKTPDAMIAVEYNHLRTSGNVSFNFNHILVGLGFVVNNYNYGEDETITIKSITLSGEFTRSITIDFNKNTNDTDFYTCSGTYSGEYKIFEGAEEVKANDSANPGNKYLLLLSDASGGTYLGKDIKVKVEYTYKGKEKTATAERPSDFMPRSGVKYTANLNFVGETFLLNFVAATGGAWDDGGDSDITIQ